MMPTPLWPVMLLTAAMTNPAEPVATLKALGPALTACFHAPEGSAGQEITLRLTLTSRGAVFGTPKITFSRLIGRTEDKRAFVAAVFSALSACTPVPVTPGLGGAIAGRPLSIHFVGGGPAQAISFTGQGR